jgi:hypothetical protein
MARNRSPAAALLALTRYRVSEDDARQRFAERDARLAADTRTDCQKYLGDPDPARSALRAVSADTTLPR